MKALKVPFKFIQIILIILIGFLVFSNTAQIKTFHYDDDLTIVDNPSIYQLDLLNIWESFRTRFIPGITFAVNYALSGLDAQAFHLTNVIIHILSALLVWILARDLIKIADNYNLIQEKFSDLIPFFVALLFLVHPVQTEAVNFITQRYMLLASFFYLATILLYVKSKLNASRFYYVASIVSCVLAMLSKEISFTLPLMIILVEFFFFRPASGMLRRKIVSLIPFGLALLIIPVVLLSTKSDMPGTTRIAQVEINAQQEETVDITRAASSFTRKEYFLTELNVLRTYLRLLILPVNQNLDYDYPIYKTFFNVHVGISLLGIIVFFFLAYRLFSINRIASFAIVWFFVVLSVESTIIPIAHVIAEYRLYLAVFGFAFIVFFLCARISKDRHGFILCASLLIAILSLVTFARNHVWRSRFSLWEDTVKKSPYKPRPNVNFGKMLTQKGDLNKAEKHYLIALERKPHTWKFSEAYTNLGVVYVKKGEIDKAIRMHLKAIELNPRDFLPHYNLGIAYSRKKDFEQEIACYQTALDLNPELGLLYFSLALAYKDNQDLKAAYRQVEKLKELELDRFAGQLEQRLKQE